MLGGRGARSREPSRPWPHSRPELVPGPGPPPQALWRIWCPGLGHCTVPRRCRIYPCWSSPPGQTCAIDIHLLDTYSVTNGWPIIPDPCLSFFCFINMFVHFLFMLSFPLRCTTCTVVSRWRRTLCLLSTWGTVLDWHRSSDTCPLLIQTTKTSYRLVCFFAHVVLVSHLDAFDQRIILCLSSMPQFM